MQPITTHGQLPADLSGSLIQIIHETDGSAYLGRVLSYTSNGANIVVQCETIAVGQRDAVTWRIVWEFEIGMRTFNYFAPSDTPLLAAQPGLYKFVSTAAHMTVVITPSRPSPPVGDRPG